MIPTQDENGRVLEQTVDSTMPDNRNGAQKKCFPCSVTVLTIPYQYGHKYFINWIEYLTYCNYYLVEIG